VSTWTIVSAPIPMGSQFSYLTGISRAGAARCIAVGTQTTTGLNRSVVASWDRSAWSVDSTPSVGDTDALTGVSCTPSTSSCVAVGSYQSLGSQFTLVERNSHP
jgi:hypothetical protein